MSQCTKFREECAQSETHGHESNDDGTDDEDEGSLLEIYESDISFS